MKTNLISFAVLILVLSSCGSSPLGQKVKEPFRGNAYESNNRFFRGTGKGESSQDNIARGKADIDAKAQLAGQVNTTMKQVADQYLGQTENANAADVPLRILIIFASVGIAYMVLGRLDQTRNRWYPK